MKQSIFAKDLACLLSGELVGDPDRAVTGIGTLEQAGPDQTAILMESKKLSAAQASNAGVMIAGMEYVHDQQTVIQVANPRHCLPILLKTFKLPECLHDGIHQTAIIPESASIGNNVSIGPYCVIGENTVIGDNTRLHAHVVVGADCRIGRDCLLYPQVTVYYNCIIGSECIIHSGAVIGSDGFGYVPVNKTGIRFHKLAG